MKLALKRAALAAAALVLSLALAEAVVRIAGLTPVRWAHPWHLESADKRHGVDVYPDDARGVFELDIRDPATQRELCALGIPEVAERAERTPHAVRLRYSEELCRGPAIGPVPPGATRIVLIGDSFTEGQGVPEDRTFAAELARRLAPAQVLNCGRRGYDFPALHELFERRLALDPDVVVYAMTLNDPQQSEEFHARQVFLDDWILDRRRMYMDDPPAPSFWEPRLFALLHDRLEAQSVARDTTEWYRGMVGPDNAAGWAATVDHVAAMHDTMTGRGGRFVVILLPLLVDLDDYPFAAVHRTIVRAFRERGVTVRDTLPAFRGKDTSALWVHPADHHPNEIAHRLIAAEIARALR